MNEDDAKYQRAKKRANDLKGLTFISASTFLVNLFLFPMNLVTSGFTGRLWAGGCSWLRMASSLWAKRGSLGATGRVKRLKREWEGKVRLKTF